MSEINFLAIYLVENTVFLLKRGQKSTKLHGYCHAAALIAKKVVIIIKKGQAAANVDRKTEAQCEKKYTNIPLTKKISWNQLSSNFIDKNRCFHEFSVKNVW